MPESLNKKKRRLYDHLNRVMAANPSQHQVLRELIIRNAVGKIFCRTPNDEIQQLNERLTALEYRINELYEMRIALLEMQLEITIKALAKVIHLYC